MKRRVTAKEIRNGYGVVLKAGYCELQHLLSGVEPYGYNAGVYGWNFDAYYTNGVTVCTGYRNMAGVRYLDWDTVNGYEKKAERICSDWGMNYEERQAALSALREEFFTLVKAAAKA